jgi:hypothetical protein
MTTTNGADIPSDLPDPTLNRTLLLAQIGELTVHLGQANTVIRELMVERDSLQRELARQKEPAA